MHHDICVCGFPLPSLIFAHLGHSSGTSMPWVQGLCPSFTLLPLSPKPGSVYRVGEYLLFKRTIWKSLLFSWVPRLHSSASNALYSHLSNYPEDPAPEPSGRLQSLTSSICHLSFTCLFLPPNYLEPSHIVNTHYSFKYFPYLSFCL